MANSSSVDIEFDIADGENPETVATKPTRNYGKGNSGRCH